jgi:hypothetical protein
MMVFGFGLVEACLATDTACARSPIRVGGEVFQG